MVLIALLVACGAPQPTPTTQPALSIHTAMVAQDPDQIDAMKSHIGRSLEAENITVVPVYTDDSWEALGTSGHRTAWLVERYAEKLTVLIEANARRRATLGGRFQWEVTTTVVVASSQLPELKRTKVMRVTLPHAHQNASDALSSAAPQIGQYTASLVRQFHGSEG